MINRDYAKNNLFGTFNIKKWIRQLLYKKESLLQISLWIILIAIAVLSASRRMGMSNFHPINGDFQNFNVVRRFIEGQVPFRDFTVYLGLGHLLLLSLPQFFWGNNFVVSLVISNTIVFLCFALFSYSISKLILKNSLNSTILTLSLCFLNFLRPEFFTKIMGEDLLLAFTYGIVPGNSAKMIRVAIVPLMVLILSRFFLKLDGFHDLKYKQESFIAAIAGVSIAWSNDGGIAWFLAFSFLYGLLHLKYKGFCINLLKSAVLYIVMSTLSLFIILTIITRGSPQSYFEQTVGINSYQFWYFGWLKPSSLFDIHMDFNTAVCVFLIIYYSFMFIKSKIDQTECMIYFWLSCIMLALYIQAVIYNIYTGLSANYVIMYLYAFIIIFMNIVKFPLSTALWSKQRYACAALLILLLLPALKLGLTGAANHRDAIYTPELGGYVSSPSPLLMNYVAERIGDEKVFATYASAIEAMTSQFQPSGTDYIIHVLGDKQREKYLESFRNDDFRYVATINPNNHTLASEYGNWIIQANWFFHRELFMDYTPVFTNEYQIYWQRPSDLQNTETPHFEQRTIDVSDSEKRIVVSTQDTSINGTVDARITYSLNFKKILHNLDFVKTMTWTDTRNNYNYNSFGLNPNSDIVTAYIPITIVNGQGEAVINSAPENNVTLEVYDFEILNFFRNPFDFAYAADINDHNWQGGINLHSNNRLVLHDIYPFNISIIEATKLKIDSQVFEIIDKTVDAGYITITLDGDASAFAFPNVFEVLYCPKTDIEKERGK